MTLAQAKHWLDTTDWYQQGAAIKNLTASYPMHVCFDMRVFGKNIPVHFEAAMFYQDHFMDWYMDKSALVAVASYYYNRQTRDPKFIDKLLDNWHRTYVGPFLKQVDYINSVDLFQLSNSELVKAFRQFNKHYIALWQEVIFLDGFDFHGEAILAQILTQEGKPVASQDLEILTAPPLPSFLQQERLALLELTEQFAKHKSTILKVGFKKTTGMLPALGTALDTHSKAFHWIRNDYAVIEYLTPEYFYNCLKKLYKNSAEIQEEKTMRTFLRTLSKRKQDVIRKYRLSKVTANKIRFLSILGNFRDERKTYTQIAGPILAKFVEAFSVRTDLSISVIEEMHYWELEQVFRKPLSSNTARKRLNGATFLFTAPKKYSVLFGKSARELTRYVKTKIAEKSELKGRPAYSGKAIGTVRIIKDQKDFHKMKQGDILVAPNTRPEYVPIMKLAAAIVTEEGGITSHAAIVSRELKIPAVVGVQSATTVLKDGQRIEVDANQGILTMLS